MVAIKFKQNNLGKPRFIQKTRESKGHFHKGKYKFSPQLITLLRQIEIHAENNSPTSTPHPLDLCMETRFGMLLCVFSPKII